MYDISPQDPRITSLSPADLSAYLHKKGWKSLPHSNERITCFSGPLDDDGMLSMFLEEISVYLET